MKMAISARFTASALILLGLVLAQKEIGDIEDGCFLGTHSYGTHCYHFFSLEATYHNAEIVCERRGGMLAVVKDPETHHFIQKLRIRSLSLNYWIGLTYRRNESVWVYSDGSRLQDFNRWGPRQSNKWRNKENCVHMWMEGNLLWDDDLCFSLYRYICQFEARNCSANATRFGPYCLELSRELATYDKADHACTSRGGILAAVKTQAMHELLKTTIYQDRWWMNISKQDMTWEAKHKLYGSWIGIRYVQGAWVYSDGTFVNRNFTKWATGEPQKNKKQEACVISGQDWHVEGCNYHNTFTCQNDRVSSQALPPLCPDSSSQALPPLCPKKLVDECRGIRLGKIEFAFLIIGCFVLGAVCYMLAFYRRHFLSNTRKRKEDNGQDMAILENEVTNPVLDDD